MTIYLWLVYLNNIMITIIIIITRENRKYKKRLLLHFYYIFIGNSLVLLKKTIFEIYSVINSNNLISYTIRHFSTRTTY